MNRTLVLSIVSCLLCAGGSLARWTDVSPAVQTITYLGGVSPIRNIHLQIDDDSLGFAAAELERRVEEIVASHGWNIRISTDAEELRDRGSIHKMRFGSVDAHRAVWEHYQDPNLLTPLMDEEYRILIDTLEGYDSESTGIYVAAASRRGYLFAVTSFWQALDTTWLGSQGLYIENAAVRDAPVFERRYTAFFEEFGNNDWYDIDPAADPQQVEADSLLAMTRNVLLYNKGNGLVHSGSPYQYDNDHGEVSVVRETLSHINTRRPARPDIWGDFGFDWFEGFGWHNEDGTQDDNTSFVYGRAKVGVRCAIGDAVNGERQLVAEPEPATWFENGDFEQFLAQGHEDEPFFPWSFGALTPRNVVESGSQFCRLLVPEFDGDITRSIAYTNTGVRNGNDFSLEPTWGYGSENPARQIVLSFSIRFSHPDIAPLIGLWPRDVNQRRDTIWDGPGFDTLRGLQVDNGMILMEGLTPSDSNNWDAHTWHRLHVVFNSYGTCGAKLQIEFRNSSSVVDTVDIDSVTILDAGFFDVFPDAEVDNDWRERVWLCRGGDSVLVESHDIRWVDMRDPNNIGATDAWRIHDGRAFLDDDAFQDTTWDYARVEYWTGSKVAEMLWDSTSDELPPFTQRRKARIDNPDLFSGVASSQMSWFNDSAAHYGINVRGYQCNENEFKARGWMPDENPPGGAFGQEVYGACLHEMYQTMPEEKPIVAWGDMYDLLHNGRRYTYSNNPHNFYHGFCDPNDNSYEIPGLSDDDSIVFVDWSVGGPIYLHDYTWPDRLARYDSSLQFWANTVDPQLNPAFECIQGYGVGNSAHYGGWNEVPWDTMARAYFDQVVARVALRREDGSRLTGGMMFFWPIDYEHADVENASYPPYYNRKEILHWLWNPNPIQVFESPLPVVLGAGAYSAGISVHAYPMDPTELDIRGYIDSVVVRYRLNGDGDWLTSGVEHESDSTYDFSISLPDSGGYGEYQTWAFDSLGSYGSQPPFGTKWKDPNAGERYYFTFERRKKDAIANSVDFYSPGIISTDHTLSENGLITIEPLPGYRYSTMTVTDSAEIGFSEGVGAAAPIFRIAGTDSSQVHFVLAEGASGWRGVTDDHIVTDFHYVTFETGTDPFEFRKTKPGDAHTLDHVEFKSPAVFSDSVSVGGNASFTQVTAESGAVLSLLPGTDFTFADSGRMVIAAGARLHAAALDTLPTAFRAAVDTLGWEGLRCEGIMTDTSVLSYCNISDADIGILANHTVVKLEHCTIMNCQTAVAAINGGSVILSDCDITGNGDGLLLTNLSTAKVVDCSISGNSGTGVIALSRSTAYLSDCDISNNGGDGLAGGIGLYTGSEAFLKCTNVEGNTGSGITSYGGAVMLSSTDSTSADAYQWRGNSVFDNETVTREGQITLRGRVGFGVFNGHNRIADSTETHPLISWLDQPTLDWYQDVYWGSTDTGAVKDRLPANVLLGKIDSSWTTCAAFAGAPTSADSLMRLFLTPQVSELAGSFASALAGYKSLIKGTPRSDFACAASDRLLITALAAGDSLSATRDFLDSMAQATTDVPLKCWLMNSIAWSLAEDDSMVHAGSIYDSLAQNTPTQLDRVSARVQRLMLSAFEFRNDTADYKAADLLSIVDSARTVLGTVNSWSQSVITDSVVMYAPCYVDTAIAIEAGGRLVVRPHPGANNAIVHFAPDAAINSYGSQGGAKLYVLGEADNPVTLQWDSSANWANVQTLGGDVYMKHAILHGKGFLSYSDATYGYFDFQIDSCEFQDFGEGIWVWAADSGSYIKNSTLTGLGGSGNDYTGMGFGTGLTVLEGEQFTVENCTLENNEGVGLFGFFCAGLDVRNTVITGSDDYGILVWDGGELNLECTEVTQNGDTLPELWVENGLVDLVEGHNLFADSGGTLIYSANPSYIDVEDGQNRFELLGGSGTYMESGSPTSTWDVTYNNWSPVTPADQDFYDHVTPDNPAKWTVDSSLASFVACGDGGAASLGSNLLIVGQEDDTPGIDTHDSDPDRGPVRISLDRQASKLAKRNGTNAQSLDRSQLTSDATTPSSPSRDAIQVHHTELARWREFNALAKSRQTAAAIDAGKQFLADAPGSPQVATALVRLASLAGRDDAEHRMSEILAEQAKQLPRAEDRRLARLLSLRTQASEGSPQAAIAGLEEMIETADTPQGSLRALVTAMGVYLHHGREGQLRVRNESIRVDDPRELARRVVRFAKAMQNPALLAVKETPAVPTEYRLYQNFPNPFNPNTEIRFDLPEAVQVQLRIFNILGQEVATLVDAMRPAGAYNILWDSKNATGAVVASGVYVYQLKAGKFVDQKKMVLIR